MVPRFAKASAPRRIVAVTVLALSLTSTLVPAASATTPAAAAAIATTPANGARALTAPAAAVPETAVLSQKVTHALTAYEAARANVARISIQSARITEMAEQAVTTAQQLRKEVGGSEGGSILDVLAGLVSDGESDLDRAAAAAEDAEHAMALAGAVEQALKDAIADTERARRAWELARADLQQVESEWTAAEAARAAVRRSEFRGDYAVTDTVQDRRNRAALRRWKNYLLAVGKAGIVPPAAAKLRDPDRLPGKLEILRDRTGRAVPGVATTDSSPALTVLPSETVRAVTATFSRVGLAEVPGAIAPSAYACGGLVANAWGATTTLPADSVNQWRELRTVPFASLQVGDVVVLGSRRSGLEQSGVYVGRRDVILADPQTGTAGVQPLPRRDLYGVKRVNLPVSRSYDAPSAGACGAETPAAPRGATTPTPRGTGDGPFVLPVAEGAFTLSARFGATSALWSSGQHTGLDFAAPTGTPVLATAGGVVTVETHDWAGNLVRIDHGGGVESWYAHLSKVDVTSGQRVTQGQQVGGVGNEGNSTGPHLHLEVRLDGSPVDPALVLGLPELPRPTYPNGEVPTTALCSATADGAQLLRCDAAVSFRLMTAAYAADTGDALCITDSYRSHAGQVQVFRAKPALAATPGTSVHGEALAVDLCGGVERFGTPAHLWMLQRGPAFDWHHPSWAAAGGSRPEPWHFEYSG